MKNTYIKFIALCLLVTFTSVSSYAQISKVDIIATGLTCSMCSNAINKQLKSLVEVDSIGTDLNTNTFTVYFKDNQELEPKVLKNAVEKAGFFVGSMVLTAKFDDDQASDKTKVTHGGATYFFMDEHGVMNGAAKFRVLDKGFVTQKEYKKLVKAYSKFPTYVTGVDRNYHLKAI